MQFKKILHNVEFSNKIKKYKRILNMVDKRRIIYCKSPIQILRTCEYLYDTRYNYFVKISWKFLIERGVSLFLT